MSLTYWSMTTTSSVILMVLLAVGCAAQDKPDFSGVWILGSPSQPTPDIPASLSVSQSVARTTARGEPMKLFFKDIAIDREFQSGTRSETYQIGIIGGVVAGFGDGRPAGPRLHHSVKWDGDAGPGAFALAIVPVAAGAQTLAQPEDGHQAPMRTFAMLKDPAGNILPGVSAAVDQTVQHPRRRDSLWNGVIIGAGVGALAGAVSGTAIVDCSECSGFNVPLTFGVLGAAIGAGLGAGIDAWHNQGAAPVQGTRHVQLAPLVAKEKRGLAAGSASDRSSPFDRKECQ
jgi:hypothetical protein